MAELCFSAWLSRDLWRATNLIPRTSEEPNGPLTCIWSQDSVDYQNTQPATQDIFFFLKHLQRLLFEGQKKVMGVAHGFETTDCLWRRVTFGEEKRFWKFYSGVTAVGQIIVRSRDFEHRAIVPVQSATSLQWIKLSIGFLFIFVQ